MTNQEAGLTSRLSMHVEPILLPIALLYRVNPHVETLLVLQAVVVALGAVPLFALARQRQLGDWMGLLFGVAYLLNPSIQAANWLEFHPLTLAPTLLMAAFYCMVVRRPGWFALFAVLAASCKEEIGLLVFMIGLYALLFQKQRRLGAITMILALGWSLVAVFGVQAGVGGGNIHWGRYGYLGVTLLDKLVTLAARPGVVLTQLQQADVSRYFFELLLPVGFTALLAPEVLLLALPSLAINLLADFSPMHQVTTLIYAAPIVAFVMLASVMGVARVINRTRIAPADTDGNALGMGSQAENSSKSVSPMLNWLFAALVLGGALVSQRLWGYLPGSGNHLALTVTDHHRRAQAIIDQIPPDAKVSVQDRLNPHVSGRETVYIFPRIDDADTVLVDVTGSAWPQHPNDLKKTVDDLLAGDFGVAAADDGYLLLSKSAVTDTLPASFFAAWQQPPAQSLAYPAGVTFDDEIQLLDYAVTTDRNGELLVTMTWQALKPLDRDLRFYVGFLDAELNVLHDSQYYQPPAGLWYPTSMWAPGEPVRMQTLPWTPPYDGFVLVVGVYAGEDGWNSGGRLSVTGATPTLPVLEEDTLARLGGFWREYASAPWMPVPPVAGVPTHALDALFGDAFRLEGAALPSPDEPTRPLAVTLYWQAERSMPKDYMRFVHLLDAAGNKVAQLDGPPHDQISELPTSAWPVAWRGADGLVLDLPADLPGGVYTIVAGLYDWETGERLPVTGADVAPGDVVRIGSVEIR